jgi:hypothetical protein
MLFPQLRQCFSLAAISRNTKIVEVNKCYLLLITLFFACNSNRASRKLSSSTQSIIGKWEVVDCNVLPFEHISYCEKLNLNSIYEFESTGELKVFENDSSKINCNQTQTFWVDSVGLNIFEYDFTFTYDLLKLSSDSLVLRTWTLPKYLSEEIWKTHSIDYENDTTRKIKRDGIIIRLKRLNNGG